MKGPEPATSGCNGAIVHSFRGIGHREESKGLTVTALQLHNVGGERLGIRLKIEEMMWM